MAFEFVDPAWEIAGAIRQLRTTPSSNDPTWSVFQKALGTGISPSEHWELMSVLQDRLLRFDQFVRSVVDTEFDDHQRRRIIQAVDRFSHALRPEHQTQQWQHTLQNYLIEDDALQLGWFSIVAKRHRPLRRVTEDERAELIAKIDEALAAVEAGQDIPEWAKLPIAEGLRRLRFTLQHLVFFGVESAVDKLLEVYNKTMAIELATGGTPNANKIPGSGRPTILTVLNCVVLAANLFWLPDQATSAFERYQGWYLKTIVENPRLPKPTTLLLAPPANGPDIPTGPSTEAVVEPTPPSEKFDEVAK